MKSISSGVTVKNKPKLVGAAKCIPQAFNWLPVGPISILGPKRRGACCANAPPLATPPSPTTHHPWPTTVGVNFRKTSLTRPRRASRLYGCRHSNWIGCLLLGSFNRCPITIQEQPFSSGHRARTYGPGLSSTVVAWRNTPLSPKLTSSLQYGWPALTQGMPDGLLLQPTILPSPSHTHDRSETRSELEFQELLAFQSCCAS